MPTLTIPKFLSHLPTHHGLPVPFTVLWSDGVPDFRVISPDQVRRSVRERLCAICGRKLGEYLWFVGGPNSLEESGLFVDPPQHEACARFALAACPFLSGKTSEHNYARPVPDQVGANPLVTPIRSQKVGIRRAKHFLLVNVDGHGLMKVVRWYGKPIWLA